MAKRPPIRPSPLATRQAVLGIQSGKGLTRFTGGTAAGVGATTAVGRQVPTAVTFQAQGVATPQPAGGFIFSATGKASGAAAVAGIGRFPSTGSFGTIGVGAQAPQQSTVDVVDALATVSGVGTNASQGPVIVTATVEADGIAVVSALGAEQAGASAIAQGVATAVPIVVNAGPTTVSAAAAAYGAASMTGVSSGSPKAKAITRDGRRPQIVVEEGLEEFADMMPFIIAHIAQQSGYYRAAR